MASDPVKELSRRGAIKVLGGAGLVTLIGCGGGATSGTPASTGRDPVPLRVLPLACSRRKKPSGRTSLRKN